MKLPATVLLPALLCTVWSCKPQDKTPRSPDESTTATPAVTDPVTTPKPAPQPEPPSAPATPGKLEVGSKVTLDAVKAATWLQGEAPESFEPGLVYIFEAWATWCGPCVKVIPHMNELHKKYHAKGLRIYGMNVFEDGEEKVANFVKKKGDEMSYPVAYTGKGSPFDIQWMKASGARGIPHSFVVIDGILRMKTHPAALEDALIEKLLNGGEEATQAINQANQAINQANQDAKSQEGMHETMSKFREAVMKNDLKAMESMVADLEKEDPKSKLLGQMKIDIMMVKKDWAQTQAALVKPPSSPAETAIVNMIISRLALSEHHGADAPQELLAKAAQISAEKITKNPLANPMDWVALSTLQFRTGETDAAKQSAHSAIDAAKKAPEGRGMPPALFQKFATEVDAGRLPTINEFSKWMQESMQKRQPAPVATPEK